MCYRSTDVSSLAVAPILCNPYLKGKMQMLMMQSCLIKMDTCQKQMQKILSTKISDTHCPAYIAPGFLLCSSTVTISNRWHPINQPFHGSLCRCCFQAPTSRWAHRKRLRRNLKRSLIGETSNVIPHRAFDGCRCQGRTLDALVNSCGMGTCLAWFCLLVYL